jgi:hypothetical protein
MEMPTVGGPGDQSQVRTVARGRRRRCRHGCRLLLLQLLLLLLRLRLLHVLEPGLVVGCIDGADDGGAGA